ncbi:MAG: hypothetical protein ACO1N1_13715 [Dyadobacter fermentans]
MPSITNREDDGRLEPGVVLVVSGAESENDAVLAFENYLRVNQKEHLELALPEKCEDGSFQVRLEEPAANG